MALEVSAGLPIPSVYTVLGFPVRIGFYYAFFLISEFVLWWFVAATAWTMGKVAASPAKLEDYLSGPGDVEEDPPRASRA